jgi:nucleoside-diphosphate-sugar epimerase
VLITTSNLYGYGPVDGAMTEQHPLRPVGAKGGVRAQMWREAPAAHTAGHSRMTEVHGSCYLGAGSQSLLTMLVLPKVLAGARVRVPADLDAVHGWTYTGDVARMLIRVATDECAWGRAWHVFTAPPVSIRDVATRASALADAPSPPVHHACRDAMRGGDRGRAFPVLSLLVCHTVCGGPRLFEVVFGPVPEGVGG